MTTKRIYTNTLIANSRGLGIIELMIALAVLASAISVAMFMVQKSKSAQSMSGFVIRVQSIRYSLMTALQNDQALTASVASASNPSFQCFRNKTSCRSSGGSFVLIDSSGATLYDGTKDTSGFANDGKLCDTFSADGVGDSSCPLHLVLSWAPVCAPNPDPCINPPIEITGEFQYWDKSRTNANTVNWAVFKFDFLRQKIYCQADPVAFALASYGSVASTNASVIPTSGGAVYPVGEGYSTTMESCGTGTTTFQYANSYTNGATVSDSANQASVCFMDVASDVATGACIYEWYVKNESWVLRSNGSPVYNALPAENGDQTAQYSFVMHNGQMTFYYGGKRRYIFPTLYGYELKAVFKPGSSDYSTGFSNITFLYQ